MNVDLPASEAPINKHRKFLGTLATLGDNWTTSMTEGLVEVSLVFIQFHRLVREHLPKLSIWIDDCNSLITIRLIGRVLAWLKDISTRM